MMSADDDRLLAAGMRVGSYFGCDTPDHMADEIVALRAEVARLREALQCVRELADNDTGDFRADLAHCVGVAEAALANETPTA